MFLVTFYMPRMWYNRRGLLLRRGGHEGRPQPPHPLQQNAFFLTDPPTVVNRKVKVNLCALQNVHWGKKKSKYQLEFVELIFILQYVCGLKSRSCWWIWALKAMLATDSGGPVS